MMSVASRWAPLGVQRVLPVGRWVCDPCWRGVDPDPFMSDTTSVAHQPSSSTPLRLTILFLEVAYLQDKHGDQSTCSVLMHGCGKATVA